MAVSVANLAYLRNSDLVVPTWALASGTARTGYGLDKLNDGRPSRRLWLNETSFRLVGDFGSAQRIDALLLVHHNLADGKTILVEGNSTNSWPGTTMGTITVAAAGEDGWTTNAGLDLVRAVPVAANRTWRYWSLSNLTNANTVAVKIGELLMGTPLRYLTHNVSWGAGRPEEHAASVLTTKTGVEAVYDMAARRREFQAEIDGNDTGLAEWRSLRRSSRGKVRPFVVFPNGSDTEEGLFVRFLEQRAEAQEVELDRNAFRFDLVEVGRGEP